MLRTLAPLWKGSRVEQFAVSESTRDRVIIEGRLDFNTVPRLRAILAGVRRDVEVDCTRMSFIDASGFDALSFGYVAATGQGYEFIVSGLSDLARRVGRRLEVPFLFPGHDASRT